MEITKDKAIQIAEEYGLEQEVTDLIDSGYSPEEALEGWDILPNECIPFLPSPDYVVLDDHYCDDGFYCDDDYYCDD